MSSCTHIAHTIHIAHAHTLHMLMHTHCTYYTQWPTQDFDVGGSNSRVVLILVLPKIAREKSNEIKIIK